MGYSHSLTGTFPRVLFALYLGKSLEFLPTIRRFSLHSLSSQASGYQIGITVWYQCQILSPLGKTDYSILTVIPTLEPIVRWLWGTGCYGTCSSWSIFIVANITLKHKDNGAGVYITDHHKIHLLPFVIPILSGILPH